MAIGLRVRDRVTGVVTLDVTDTLTRIIGMVNSGFSSGSISVPEFANGRPWYYTDGPSFSNPFRFGRQVVVTISGTTLSWSFSQGIPADAYNATNIVYGIY